MCVWIVNIPIYSARKYKGILSMYRYTACTASVMSLLDTFMIYDDVERSKNDSSITPSPLHIPPKTFFLQCTTSPLARHMYIFDDELGTYFPDDKKWLAAARTLHTRLRGQTGKQTFSSHVARSPMEQIDCRRLQMGVCRPRQPDANDKLTERSP